MSETLGSPSNIDIVLCAGTHKVGDVYMPTTYEQGDGFGMLGGEMRVLAAVARAQAGLSERVLFSGGKSKKGNAGRGGAHVPAPAAAAVYGSQFSDIMRTETDLLPIQQPTVLLDTHSPNTNTNILYGLKLAEDEAWPNISLISSNYHIPRVKALFGIVQQALNIESVQVEFLSAEQIVRAALPGVYDTIIDRAYTSESGQQRLQNEARGLADIHAGRYIFKEVEAHDLSQRPS